MIKSKVDLNTIKREKYPWMYEVTKCAAEYAFIDLNQAITNHFKNPKHFGFPKPKTKKNSPLKFGISNDHFGVEGHNLFFAKMDAPVNLAEELRFVGRLMACRISFTAGHWYASIIVEVEKENKPKKLVEEKPAEGKALGIDLGIKTLATLSNGQKFENQKHLGQAQPLLRRLNRKLSRSQRFSHNHEKVVLKLGRAYAKVTNLRTDQYYKTVGEILKGDFDLIGLENLNVKGMLKNKKLARQFADVAFSTFKRILIFKAEALGVTVIDVGRFYPSSQICHACKYQYHELTLAERA
jgi:putative transposase